MCNAIGAPPALRSILSALTGKDLRLEMTEQFLEKN